MSHEGLILHAGLVARRVKGRWLGALIEGPSGIGKSDLALRCLEAGATLVADDRVLAWTDQGRLWGRAPDPLAGLMEVRGVGIVRRPALASCPIALIIDCQPRAAAVERMPREAFAERLGVRLPVRPLWPFEPAAATKLLSLLDRVGHRG
ncbi:HPr kinase/phosphorylase [Caulobacter sp. SLTY]|uniref:HPr kinase/phosphorylase n=1 Tax=Caulobacter sp. SLTY TaxID=2683262 RepID=UPI003211EAA4